MNKLLVPILLLLLAACAQVPARGDAPLALLEFGSAGYDTATGLAKHNSGVYAVGFTSGELDGPQQGGGELDAFIRKYSADGSVIWADQFGTDQIDAATGVASDGRYAYVVGLSYGSLGAPYSGNDDTFLRKYDPSGNLLWTRQFAEGYADFPSRIAVLGRHIYAVGTANPYTSDSSAFIKKFGPDGAEIWTDTFGTKRADRARDVAVDRHGNAYVVGVTYGSLAAPGFGSGDMFIRKYTPRGTVAWTRQLNYIDDDVAAGVAVNGSNLYLAGSYKGAQDRDVRILKLTTGNSLVWDAGFDLGGDEDVTDVSASSGEIVVSGATDGVFAGPNRGGDDGFVVKLSSRGERVWAQSQGTSADDSTAAVLLRNGKEVYAAGSTDGTLGSANRGGTDAFLTRLRRASGTTVWTDQ